MNCAVLQNYKQQLKNISEEQKRTSGRRHGSSSDIVVGPSSCTVTTSLTSTTRRSVASKHPDSGMDQDEDCQSLKGSCSSGSQKQKQRASKSVRPVSPSPYARDRNSERGRSLKGFVPRNDKQLYRSPVVASTQRSSIEPCSRLPGPSVEPRGEYVWCNDKVLVVEMESLPNDMDVYSPEKMGRREEELSGDKRGAQNVVKLCNRHGSVDSLRQPMSSYHCQHAETHSARHTASSTSPVPRYQRYGKTMAQRTWVADNCMQDKRGTAKVLSSRKCRTRSSSSDFMSPSSHVRTRSQSTGGGQKVGGSQIRTRSHSRGGRQDVYDGVQIRTRSHSRGGRQDVYDGVQIRTRSHSRGGRQEVYDGVQIRTRSHSRGGRQDVYDGVQIRTRSHSRESANGRKYRSASPSKTMTNPVNSARTKPVTSSMQELPKGRRKGQQISVGYDSESSEDDIEEATSGPILLCRLCEKEYQSMFDLNEHLVNFHKVLYASRAVLPLHSDSKTPSHGHSDVEKGHSVKVSPAKSVTTVSPSVDKKAVHFSVTRNRNIDRSESVPSHGLQLVSEELLQGQSVNSGKESLLNLDRIDTGKALSVDEPLTTETLSNPRVMIEKLQKMPNPDFKRVEWDDKDTVIDTWTRKPKTKSFGKKAGSSMPNDGTETVFDNGHSHIRVKHGRGRPRKRLIGSADNPIAILSEHVCEKPVQGRLSRSSHPSSVNRTVESDSEQTSEDNSFSFSLESGRSGSVGQSTDSQTVRSNRAKGAHVTRKTYLPSSDTVQDDFKTAGSSEVPSVKNALERDDFVVLSGGSQTHSPTKRSRRKMSNSFAEPVYNVVSQTEVFREEMQTINDDNKVNGRDKEVDVCNSSQISAASFPTENKAPASQTDTDSDHSAILSDKDHLILENVKLLRQQVSLKRKRTPVRQSPRKLAKRTSPCLSVEKSFSKFQESCDSASVMVDGESIVGSPGKAVSALLLQTVGLYKKIPVVNLDKLDICVNDVVKVTNEKGVQKLQVIRQEASLKATPLKTGGKESHLDDSSVTDGANTFENELLQSEGIPDLTCGEVLLDTVQHSISCDLVQQVDQEKEIVVSNTHAIQAPGNVVEEVIAHARGSEDVGVSSPVCQDEVVEPSIPDVPSPERKENNIDTGKGDRSDIQHANCNEGTVTLSNIDSHCANTQDHSSTGKPWNSELQDTTSSTEQDIDKLQDETIKTKDSNNWPLSFSQVLSRATTGKKMNVVHPTRHNKTVSQELNSSDRGCNLPSISQVFTNFDIEDTQADKLELPEVEMQSVNVDDLIHTEKKDFIGGTKEEELEIFHLMKLGGLLTLDVEKLRKIQEKNMKEQKGNSPFSAKTGETVLLVKRVVESTAADTDTLYIGNFKPGMKGVEGRVVDSGHSGLVERHGLSKGRVELSLDGNLVREGDESTDIQNIKESRQKRCSLDEWKPSVKPVSMDIPASQSCSEFIGPVNSSAVEHKTTPNVIVGRVYPACDGSLVGQNVETFMSPDIQSSMPLTEEKRALAEGDSRSCLVQQNDGKIFDGDLPKENYASPLAKNSSLTQNNTGRPIEQYNSVAELKITPLVQQTSQSSLVQQNMFSLLLQQNKESPSEQPKSGSPLVKKDTAAVEEEGAASLGSPDASSMKSRGSVTDSEEATKQCLYQCEECKRLFKHMKSLSIHWTKWNHANTSLIPITSQCSTCRFCGTKTYHSRHEKTCSYKKSKESLKDKLTIVNFPGLKTDDHTLKGKKPRSFEDAACHGTAKSDSCEVFLNVAESSADVSLMKQFVQGSNHDITSNGAEYRDASQDDRKTIIKSPLTKTFKEMKPEETPLAPAEVEMNMNTSLPKTGEIVESPASISPLLAPPTDAPVMAGVGGMKNDTSLQSSSASSSDDNLSSDTSEELSDSPAPKQKRTMSGQIFLDKLGKKKSQLQCEMCGSTFKPTKMVKHRLTCKRPKEKVVLPCSVSSKKNLPKHASKPYELGSGQNKRSRSQVSGRPGLLVDRKKSRSEMMSEQSKPESNRTRPKIKHKRSNSVEEPKQSVMEEESKWISSRAESVGSQADYSNSPKFRQSSLQEVSRSNSSEHSDGSPADSWIARSQTFRQPGLQEESLSNSLEQSEGSQVDSSESQLQKLRQPSLEKSRSNSLEQSEGSQVDSSESQLQKLRQPSLEKSRSISLEQSEGSQVDSSESQLQKVRQPSSQEGLRSNSLQDSQGCQTLLSKSKSTKKLNQVTLLEESWSNSLLETKRSYTEVSDGLRSDKSTDLAENSLSDKDIESVDHCPGQEKALLLEDNKDSCSYDSLHSGKMGLMPCNSDVSGTLSEIKDKREKLHANPCVSLEKLSLSKTFVLNGTFLKQKGSYWKICSTTPDVSGTGSSMTETKTSGVSDVSVHSDNEEMEQKSEQVESPPRDVEEDLPVAVIGKQMDKVQSDPSKPCSLGSRKVLKKSAKDEPPTCITEFERFLDAQSAKGPRKPKNKHSKMVKRKVEDKPNVSVRYEVIVNPTTKAAPAESNSKLLKKILREREEKEKKEEFCTSSGSMEACKPWGLLSLSDKEKAEQSEEKSCIMLKDHQGTSTSGTSKFSDSRPSSESSIFSPTSVLFHKPGLSDSVVRTGGYQDLMKQLADFAPQKAAGGPKTTLLDLLPPLSKSRSLSEKDTVDSPLASAWNKRCSDSEDDTAKDGLFQHSKRLLSLQTADNDDPTKPAIMTGTPLPGSHLMRGLGVQSPKMSPIGKLENTGVSTKCLFQSPGMNPKQLSVECLPDKEQASDSMDISTFLSPLQPLGVSSRRRSAHIMAPVSPGMSSFGPLGSEVRTAAVGLSHVPKSPVNKANASVDGASSGEQTGVSHSERSHKNQQSCQELHDVTGSFDIHSALCSEIDFSTLDKEAAGDMEKEVSQVEKSEDHVKSDWFDSCDSSVSGSPGNKIDERSGNEGSSNVHSMSGSRVDSEDYDLFEADLVEKTTADVDVELKEDEVHTDDSEEEDDDVLSIYASSEASFLIGEEDPSLSLDDPSCKDSADATEELAPSQREKGNQQLGSNLSPVEVKESGSDMDVDKQSLQGNIIEVQMEGSQPRFPIYPRDLIPDGFCFHQYTTGQSCTNQKCRYQHNNPPEELLVKHGMKKLERLCQEHQLARAWNVFREVESYLGPSQFLMMFNLCVNEGNVPYAYHVIRCMEKASAITDLVINRFIYLCGQNSQLYQGLLWELFQAVRFINLLPAGDAVMILLRAFADHGKWNCLWNVMTYCTEVDAFTVPYPIQSGALAMAVKEPDIYFNMAIQWLQTCDVENLQHIDEEVLQGLCLVCRKRGHADMASAMERRTAMQRASPMSEAPSSEDTWQEPDPNVLPDLQSQESKSCLNRILGTFYSKNWSYLGEVFVELGCPIHPKLTDQFADVLCRDKTASSTQNISATFADFMLAVDHAFNKEKIENRLAVKDEQALARIGNTLLQLCYNSNNRQGGMEILHCLKQAGVDNLRLRCPKHSEVPLQVLDLCIHQCELAEALHVVTVTKCSSLNNIQQQHWFEMLLRLYEQFLRKNYHQQCFQLLEQLVELCNTEKTKNPNRSIALSQCFSAFITQCLAQTDVNQALDIYKLFNKCEISINLDFIIWRSLLSACMTAGYEKVALAIFQKCKIFYPHQNVQNKVIALESWMIPSEVRYIVMEYLQCLYNYLCDCRLEGQVLTYNHLHLRLIIRSSREQHQQPFPFLMEVPVSLASAQQMLQGVLSSRLCPPLNSQVNPRDGAVIVNPSSLGQYLTALDLNTGRRQGLTFHKMDRCQQNTNSNMREVGPGRGQPVMNTGHGVISRLGFRVDGRGGPAYHRPT